MEIKICTKCGMKKPLDDFKLKKDKNGKYYRYSYCKECDYILNKEYRKKYYLLNKEKIKKRHKEYNEKNKEKIKLYHIKYNKQYLKEWRKEHPDKVKRHIKNMNKKIEQNSLLKLKIQSRDAVRNAFRRKGFLKNTKTQKILGCNYTIFIKHLLETFKNNYNYKWDKKEKVNIDHIIPLSVAKSKKDVENLFYYTNLQLLKENDNWEKSNKLDFKIKN